ncbi:MAG: cytochrome c3 family protein, partial [Desulfobacterales bacterium]
PAFLRALPFFPNVIPLKSCKYIFLPLLIIIFLFWGCLYLPEQKEPKTTKPTTKPAVISTTGTTVITETTNIHYTGKYCDLCHERTPIKGGDIYLKYNGDYQILCRCHRGMSRGYCHPLDINSELDQKLPIPPDFPLRNGRFTCDTCHHVYRQCVKRLFGRYMLRGAPYPRKTDFCYVCHDRKKYQQLNAHLQIKANGALDIKMCLYCHKKKPFEKTATYSEVTFIGDMRTLCRRCHPFKGKHPDDFNHMAKPPPAKALKRMEVMEKNFDIILPLAKDGKMTCVTCHNPHEKGVIAANKPAAKGAGSKYRERLPGILCIECHPK